MNLQSLQFDLSAGLVLVMILIYATVLEDARAPSMPTVSSASVTFLFRSEPLLRDEMPTHVLYSPGTIGTPTRDPSKLVFDFEKPAGWPKVSAAGFSCGLKGEPASTALYYASQFDPAQLPHQEHAIITSSTRTTQLSQILRRVSPDVKTKWDTEDDMAQEWFETYRVYLRGLTKPDFAMNFWKPVWRRFSSESYTYLTERHIYGSNLKAAHNYSAGSNYAHSTGKPHKVRRHIFSPNLKWEAEPDLRPRMLAQMMPFEQFGIYSCRITGRVLGPKPLFVSLKPRAPETEFRKVTILAIDFQSPRKKALISWSPWSDNSHPMTLAVPEVLTADDEPIELNTNQTLSFRL